MLILTRRTNESIMLGDDIEVVILDMHGKQARIGIKAPPGIKIFRDEVYQRIISKDVIDVKGISKAS